MDRSHHTSDEQSLRLTLAAVALLQAQHERIHVALKTPDHWDRVAPEESAPLRQLWRDMLVRRDFARALARVLPQAERLSIIRACKGRSRNT